MYFTYWLKLNWENSGLPYCTEVVIMEVLSPYERLKPPMNQLQPPTNTIDAMYFSHKELASAAGKFARCNLNSRMNDAAGSAMNAHTYRQMAKEAEQAFDLMVVEIFGDGTR